MATPSTHCPVTSKESPGDISSSDIHDGDAPSSPTTSGSLNATCIHPRGSVPIVKTLMILMVTLTSGTKDKMISTPFGKARASSSLVNMTPLVYSTQNGSKVVGEELGAEEGIVLGMALGVELGATLGSSVGELDGQLHAMRSL